MSSEYDELRQRVLRLTEDAYAPEAPWQLRDVALPLALDLFRAIPDPEGSNERSEFEQIIDRIDSILSTAERLETIAVEITRGVS